MRWTQNRYALFRRLWQALVVNMNISNILKSIVKVDSNNNVNLLFSFNDNYSLLIEGSFYISLENQTLINSEKYADSNFSSELLLNIQSLLESQQIKEAVICEKTGSLSIKLQNGLYFVSNYSENDFQSWELHKNGNTIYDSQGGSIVYY